MKISTLIKMQSLKYLLISFMLITGYGLMAQTTIWAKKVPDASAFFYGIGYGNNYFITGDYNSGQMYKSTDNGQTWTTTSILESPSSVAYGNNIFVVTDNNMKEYVYSSTDNGDTWTGSSLPSTGISMCTGAVIYGGGEFITYSSNGSTGSLFTSTDGKSWSTVFSDKDPESNSGLTFNGLCYANGMYVAVGTGLHGRIFTSTNTTTWTSRSNPISSYMAGVAYGNNIFVAISNAGEVITSTDGIIWSSSPVYIASTSMNSIAFGNGYFYAVGNSGTIIKSSDGINWTTEASGITVDLYGITYGNGYFIATGDQGVILVQEGPPTVTTTAISTYGATSATMGGNVTADGGVTVSERGVVYSSSDATPTIGETGVTKDANGTGTGSFNKSVTGLNSNTTYYACAYATNLVGTSYGEKVMLLTLAIVPSSPTVNTPTATSLNVTVNPNGNPASTQFCIQETSTGKYVQTDGTLGASSVWQDVATWGTKTVTGLTAATTYTFQVKARNSGLTETAYGATAFGITSATIPGAPTGVSGTRGNAQASVAFTAPASNGGSAIISYTVTSSPGGLTDTGTSSPIVVTGLTNGTAYTFTVTATNGVGTSSASSASSAVTPATVPGSPTAVSATSGNGQATVTFTAPASNGGSAISGYTVTSNPESKTGTGTTSPITVTGLTNGTAYTFTVTAANTVGTSAASAASNSVTSKADQTISFANPGSKDFGTSPTLVATASSGLGVTFTTSTSDVCSITSDGVLTLKKAGTCIILVDQVGDPAYHAAPQVSQSFTVNAVVPDIPTIGTAAVTNGQASVSFTPSVSNGGADVTYTVTSSPGTLTGTGITSPLTVTGLLSGTAYTFTVTATNTAGTSIASAASNSVTPNKTQTITFENPGNQNFGTSPALSATATSGVSVTFSTTTPDVCSITSDGILTFKKAGSCTIFADQAGNEVYTAAPTVSQTFTVNAVTPGTPVIGTATPGDGVASVSFTAPSSNGGADVTYTVTSSPGNFTGSGTTSPITVTSLANGTSYTFTVTAANIAGTSIASAASNSVIAYSAPIVTTDAASDITSSGAMLKGTVSANGSSTTVTFEYGTTAAYGTSVTATQSPVIEIAGIAVSKVLTGLISNTTYHYRVVGVNTGGTTNGLDQTFTTDLNTGLDNAAATVFSLYPNPTSEGFYIHAGDVSTLLSICDLSGRTVLTQQVTGNSYVNINSLQNGVYVVKVNGMVAKLVKK